MSWPSSRLLFGRSSTRSGATSSKSTDSQSKCRSLGRSQLDLGNINFTSQDHQVKRICPTQNQCWLGCLKYSGLARLAIAEGTVDPGADSWKEIESALQNTTPACRLFSGTLSALTHHGSLFVFGSYAGQHLRLSWREYWPRLLPSVACSLRSTCTRPLTLFTMAVESPPGWR